jgi:hypothetical protein
MVSMRSLLLPCFVLALACTEEGSKPDPLTLHTGEIQLPQVYPPVREATPSELIADAQYAGSAPSGPLDAVTELGRARQAQTAINLATAIQERFYSGGPTHILRIIKELDDRVLALDTDPSAHPCLTAAPVSSSYTLPAGQRMDVKLQCLQEFGAPGSAGAGWLAFGFDQASAADAGPAEAGEGNDFYLIMGQETGNGGAYHVAGATGNVEAWIAVADENVPLNSQVLMHLVTDKAASTLELALGGAAVGFCSAHLKTSPDHLFVSGRTNAVPPPGAPMAGQYCEVTRAGCYETAALTTDLGENSPTCMGVGPSTFAITVGLDASTDAGANVTPAQIWRYFSQRPVGVPTF